MPLKANRELETLAYHEAGHAIACCEFRIKFDYVTLLYNEQKESLGSIALSKFQLHTDFDDSRKECQRAERYLLAALSGPVVESIFTKRRDVFGSDDFEKAYFIALNIFGSLEVATAYLNFLLAQSNSLFVIKDGGKLYYTSAWDKVTKLLPPLMDKKYLTYQQVRAIIR